MCIRDRLPLACAMPFSASSRNAAGTSIFGISNLGMSNFGISNFGISNFGISNFGISNLGESVTGAAIATGFGFDFGVVETVSAMAQISARRAVPAISEPPPSAYR